MIPDAGDNDSLSNLIDVAKWIHLEEDLVNTIEEIGTSNYLQPESFVSERVKCASTGRPISFNVSIQGRAKRAYKVN